jgi:hypothetical protein
MTHAVVETGRPTPAVASSDSHNGLFSTAVAKGWARRVREHMRVRPGVAPEVILVGLGMEEPRLIVQVVNALARLPATTRRRAQVGILAILAGFLAGCGPKCIEGHHVTVRQEAYSWVHFIDCGKGCLIPVVHDEPARDVQRFVCDVYEPEAR